MSIQNFNVKILYLYKQCLYNFIFHYLFFVFICRVNQEEDHPRSVIERLDSSNLSDPTQFSANFTRSLPENAQFKSGLTRYECIYIYTSKYKNCLHIY